MANCTSSSHTGQAKKRRRRSESGPPANRATRKDSNAQAAATGGEEVEGVLSDPRAARAMWGGGKMQAVAANLEREDVMQEGEDNIGGEAREGAVGHPQPSEAPGEVRKAGLNLGPGKGGSELGIEAL